MGGGLFAIWVIHHWPARVVPPPAPPSEEPPTKKETPKKGRRSPKVSIRVSGNSTVSSVTTASGDVSITPASDGSTVVEVNEGGTVDATINGERVRLSSKKGEGKKSVRIPRK
jgi:hypothetical protein